MMFTMSVTLYTSRVILNTLGINDYGIYQSVGGVVGLLSFLNNVFANGSSRFLTFELGKNNIDKLQSTFSTIFVIHFFIALIIAFSTEILGIWFIHNKLVIDAARTDAALMVLHFSVITSIFSIIQAPYSALIIAYERMNIYAYMSIVEVSLKLLIVYLISMTGWDRLILYSILLCLCQICIVSFYRIYCSLQFKDAKFIFVFDRNVFKNVSNFSFWSLFSNIAIALANQGITILTNMFFSSSIVVARTLSIQVSMSAMQFVTNFRTAVNPQIVKKYAHQDYEGSRKLLLESTKYSFFLMYLLGLPILLLAGPLLQIWLDVVPDYSIPFLQIIVVQSLFSVFDASLYTALYAKGDLKLNAMISPIIMALQFPVVYILFKNDFSPLALSWSGLVVAFILGCVAKPLIVHKVANYPYKEIFHVFKKCALVVICSAPFITYISFIIKGMLGLVGHFIITIMVSSIIIIITVYVLGLDNNTRNKINKYILHVFSLNSKKE